MCVCVWHVCYTGYGGADMGTEDDELMMWDGRVPAGALRCGCQAEVHDAGMEADGSTTHRLKAVSLYGSRCFQRETDVRLGG